jgi:CRISPR/Cas system-associated exonuclease Cas4 (RecB family)
MIDVISQIMDLKRRKIYQYPVHSNRASSLGHPCERYLVYERTKWKEKILHDIKMQFLYDEGSLHESAVIREMQEAGLKIIEQQRSFEWKKYQITGHIDGKIVNGQSVIPFEIKSMSDYIWKSINSIEDMKNSKHYYLKQYPAQLNLYLIMDEKEEGLFILKNKQTGFLKQIEVKLDYEYTESLIQKAERINKHVDDGTLPERIPYEIGACENCGYYHICLPSQEHKPIIIDDPEIEIKLEKREELKEYVNEYNELDKEIREKFKEIPEVVIGNWKITGKWVEKKEYTVPAMKYWHMLIKKIK